MTSYPLCTTKCVQLDPTHLSSCFVITLNFERSFDLILTCDHYFFLLLFLDLLVTLMTTSIRFLWMHVVCIIAILTCLSHGISSSSSNEYYQLYSMLENALIAGQNKSSRSNLQTVADVFFPKRNLEPICVPIRYTLCNDTWEVEDEVPIQRISNCSHRYLWTEYALTTSIGSVLLSYSKNAIVLKGFDWVRSCLLESDTEIVLQMSSLEYNESLLDDCLGDLTSQLKAYADAQGIPSISSKYRRYAINWNEHDISLHDTMITVQIIAISIFIFFFALSSSDILYQNLFNSIYDSKNHHSTNPGYALYWGVVVLSIIWNIGPSWLVISNSRKAIYSLAILIPLLLLVAILVKKTTCFPIPGFKSVGCLLHTNDEYSFKVKCVSNTLRCAIQVFSIWSLLVTFAFIMHYFTSIVIAFYLNPLGSLIKILFIKTVAISSIFILALLFTVDRFECACTWSAVKKNVTSLIATITILSVLPLLGWLVYVVGEIIFIDFSHSSSWQSILTVIPAAMLLFVSWFSHGLLFPKGMENPTQPGREVIHDLEGNGSCHKSHPLKTDKVLANTETTPLCAIPH